ncbi:MAG: hypothetical protein H7Y43_01025, partial [Akkermansiaceae bacterium]|nr:hypothetical protein [Verrucomicrobiales bacterium]
NGTNAYRSAGNVGIGTNTPAAALHIKSGGLAVTGQSGQSGAGKGVFLDLGTHAAVVIECRSR